MFAPRCRGVAAKRGGEVASYTGQRWQPDETWMLYNRYGIHKKVATVIHCYGYCILEMKSLGFNLCPDYRDSTLG